MRPTGSVNVKSMDFSGVSISSCIFFGTGYDVDTRLILAEAASCACSKREEKRKANIRKCIMEVLLWVP